MRRYIKASNSRYRMVQNETNDCTVIAMSIVCRTTYKDAHNTLKQLGRKNGNGARVSSVVVAMRDAGFKVIPVTKLKQKSGSQYTAKTIGNKFKRGYYLCFSHDHAFAVVNGDVEDWTNNRKHHVKTAFKIVRRRAGNYNAV